MSSLADAIEIVQPCVVQVRVTGDGFRPIPVGTGFIVDQAGFVLTARHVSRDAFAIAAAQAMQNPRIIIGLAQSNSENMRANFVYVDGILIEEDQRHDLALIRMRPNPFEGTVASGIVINGEAVPLLFAVAERSSDRPRDGSPIAVSGYPLSSTVLVTTSGALASAWALDIEEVAPPGLKVPDIKDSYLADVSVNPGNSGGPVYRIDDRTIIGVCRAFQGAPVFAGQEPAKINGESLSYNSGLSVVVPIRYGEELLTRHLVLQRQPVTFSSAVVVAAPGGGLVDPAPV